MTTSNTPGSPIRVRAARPEEAASVAWLAALTFPLACPPGTPVATMAAHVADRLSPAQFHGWVTSDRHELLVAVKERPGVSTAATGTGQLRTPVGYALVAWGEPAGAAERDVLLGAVGPGPYAELSKIYVHPHAQGTGVASRLMEASVSAAARLAAEAGASATLWLGTNGANRRAQAFYRKHGFEVAGTRTYDVGGVQHDDVVMIHRP